jgi:hypothetical protein
MRVPIIWKEWHEQRWKLAFGTVMLVFFTCSMAIAHVVSFKEVVATAWLIGANILWLYSAMGVFAPEQSNGTLPFLVSKPIRPLRVFLVKLLFGWLNFALPLIAAYISLSIVCFATGEPDSIPVTARAMAAALCFGTVLYTLTCCLAPSKSGEAFVGLTGILVLLTVTFYTMLGASTIFRLLEGPRFKGSLLSEAVFGTCPVYLFDIANQFVRPWPKNLVYFEQAAIVLLALWFGYRKWQRRS